MKRMVRNSLVAIAAVALAPAAWALAGGEGLTGTPHDFTTTGTGDLHDTVAGAEGLCTFCHTPHKAQSTLLLWNHTLSGSSFSWDVTATTAGTTLPTLTPSYGGVSVKCLSCHDGTVAIGDIAWYKEQAWTVGGSGPLLNQSITTALGGQATDHLVAGAAAGEFLIANGNAAGNMAGNHPVGIAFPYGGVANTYNGTTNGAAAALLASDFQPNPLTSTVANIRLFQNTGTNFSAIQSSYAGTNVGIECSSCHDPHNKQSVDDLFLRGKFAGSSQADGYICEQCHKKGSK